jgi:uncharacterized membrane protein YbhN (UPF0104 family)
MKRNDDNPLRRISGIRVFYPVIIGLGVVLFFYLKDYNPKAMELLKFTRGTFMFIGLAFLFMIMRDIGYMFRIRILSSKELSWVQAFRVIMLWEFSSAVLPSAVGGTTVAPLYINMEGITLGRSTAVVLATSFLDELYFILMFPLLLFTITTHTLFAVGVHGTNGEIFTLTNEFLWFAVIGYSLKFVYALFLSYGLFINPRGLKWLLMTIFKLPFLRRWRYGAHITGSDIITSSLELRSKPFSFWAKAFGATFFSWCSRYLVVNALFLGFLKVTDHFLLFARQLVMSNMQLVAPTPGGSGFSEIIFKKYLADFVPADPMLVGGIIIVIVLLWRLVSYYPYLLIGAIILPSWIKKHIVKK